MGESGCVEERVSVWKRERGRERAWDRECGRECVG